MLHSLLVGQSVIREEIGGWSVSGGHQLSEPTSASPSYPPPTRVSFPGTLVESTYLGLRELSFPEFPIVPLILAGLLWFQRGLGLRARWAFPILFPPSLLLVLTVLLGLPRLIGHTCSAPTPALPPPPSPSTGSLPCTPGLRSSCCSVTHFTFFDSQRPEMLVLGGFVSQIFMGGAGGGRLAVLSSCRSQKPCRR